MRLWFPTSIVAGGGEIFHQNTAKTIPHYYFHCWTLSLLSFQITVSIHIKNLSSFGLLKRFFSIHSVLSGVAISHRFIFSRHFSATKQRPFSTTAKNVQQWWFRRFRFSLFFFSFSPVPCNVIFLLLFLLMAFRTACSSPNFIVFFAFVVFKHRDWIVWWNGKSSVWLERKCEKREGNFESWIYFSLSEY